ncbi:hypothetical protein Tco_1122588 [Tanacetum coccineum]|uniref:Integrase, catalytic region, zinc finger, CCHC-type, peptidase aspartic, catalytic n=1 Tax=Tanacetum coccineum TaxID=301880 RepID=A0ABQ5J0Z2_9ASTR
MDSIISLGQKNTLTEYMILSGADNRPPMLDKDLNGVIRTKKYAELSVVKKSQADCDMKATNIILQGLLANIYSLVNHHRVAKDLWERVQLQMQVAYQSPQAPTQLMTESLFVDTGFAVRVFSPGDDPISCLNKAMAFLTVVASSSNTYKSNATSSRGNTTSGQARVVKCYNCQEAQEAGQILKEEQLAFLADLGIPASQTQTVIPHNAAFQTEDLDTYDLDCNDLSTAQAVLIANISNYGSDVISEVPNSETYLNDMDNQSVHALQDFEQSQAQQDSMILSMIVIEQMSEQMINHVNNWEKANKEHNNESITAELERYKERVKTFEQRLNINLYCCEKMIDSQMDDMIREKLALKEQINSLEQNLSKQIKENESLFKTFTVFKN